MYIPDRFVYKFFLTCFSFSLENIKDQFLDLNEDFKTSQKINYIINSVHYVCFYFKYIFSSKMLMLSTHSKILNVYDIYGYLVFKIKIGKS
jgi:hypothetical protein